jgi:hypothetical protein
MIKKLKIIYFINMLGIATDNQGWVNELKTYDHNRKNLSYKIEEPEIITHKKVRELDRIYNPITQKYNNKEYNSRVENIEKKHSVDNIIRNTDHALKLEQHFNIINLQDKLKGLERHPNYPRQDVEGFRKNLEVSKVDYNIVSNVGLDKHHYAKPENRPGVFDTKQKNRRYYAAAHTDYNNVYNRYLLNHDEKIRTEREAGQLEAAHKYWRRNDYDPIKIKYIDNEKEDKYQEDAKQAQKVVKQRLPDIDLFKG